MLRKALYPFASRNLNSINFRMYSDDPDNMEHLLHLRDPSRLDPGKEVFGVRKVSPFDRISTEVGEAPGIVSGIPEEYRSRVGRIFQRSKSVMQQGTDNTKEWILEFDTRERWENPTIGWISSGDSLSNISLEFPSMTAAIRYAEKEGFKWFHDKPHVKKEFKKSYADNFPWNRRTRVSTK